MDENRKRAYRYLLYMAMLDIRVVCLPPESDTLDAHQIREHHQRSRRAASLAHWLHNLAYSSGNEFLNFNEDEFWKNYEWHRSRFPTGGFDYKQEFEDELKRAPKANRGADKATQRRVVASRWFVFRRRS